MLERISSPADVKALSPDELSLLAVDLRTAIVEAVSRSGGHLGSNLGVVELTIALHRVLDLPDDQLVWDTGHQAYAHKMLTGRAAGFERLRQAGGLSGYPARAESPYDLVENSHASTALSWIAGLAAGGGAEPADGAVDSRRFVAVIGDGALTGGMAYEALSNLGHHGFPAIVVANDNGRSYAETVSRLTDAGSLRAFVEALGLRYLGPYDGHDVPALEAALHRASVCGGPVLVHVRTSKGRGYAPAELDVEKHLHDTSAFDVATGRAGSDKPRSWTQAFSEVAVELAERRPELVAITAAMPGSTGLLPLAAEHPSRVVDVGIAEQHAVTFAAGLARTGRLPLVVLYSTFFSRAFDQANLDVGLHGEHVVFVLDRAGITGDDGPSHHGVLDMVLALRIPGMTVLAPSCEQDLRELLTVATDLEGPVLVRFPKGAVRSRPAPPQEAPVANGLSARRLRRGGDVCLLAIGDRVPATLEAAELLAAEGISGDVWDVRSVRPADPRMVAAAARAPLVVTVENGLVGGGAGAELGDRIAELAGVRHAPAVLRLGVPTTYVPHGRPDRILAELGLDGPGIAAATRKVLGDGP